MTSEPHFVPSSGVDRNLIGTCVNFTPFGVWLVAAIKYDRIKVKWVTRVEMGNSTAGCYFWLIVYALVD